MWVYTQARKVDGRMFLLDLTHLGVISINGPFEVDGEHMWTIEASDGTTTWILAEANNLTDAAAIQRKIFNCLAIGEKALNLNSMKRHPSE